MVRNKRFCCVRKPHRPLARNADRFAYNRRGEVASATVAGEPSAYAYDGIGNFTSVTGGAVTNTYAANELNQYEEIASGGTTLEPTYTANGELASFGDWTYAYDALSRLVAAYSNGTLVVSNRYDHLGRRVQKIAPGGTHTFLYDGWRPVVESVAKPGGGTDRIEYHWGKDLSGTLDGAAGVGGLLYVKRNGEIYVPFGDAFGNVMGYWDEQGNVVAEYAYDAFGRTVAQSGVLADAFAIRYSTKYYDIETGMYFYGKRYYLTALCRWLTRDPIEEQGGVNLYGFVGNSATRKWDSLGLKSESQWIDIGSSHELHVWNCDEWTRLTDGKAGGTQAKYVEHFKTVTFKSVLVVPEDYILYLSYGIVSTLGMSADPSSYWCLDISPLTLQKKCVKGKYKYRVKMAVKRLDKHPRQTETPEQHMKEKEGRVFYYGPK